MTYKRFDITAFGELLIDFTSVGVNENSQTIFTQNPGGAPANVLVSAQKLGCSTAFLGKVGNDMHGLFLKNILEKEDVNVEGLVIDNKFFTTLAFVKTDSKTGEREFSFSRKPGADTQITKNEINTKIIEDSKIFHIGSLSLTDEPAREATYYALDYAKKCGCKISYDPNYRAALWNNEENAKKSMRSILPYTDYIKISDEEIELLTDEKTPEKAAEKLLKTGIETVVITLGKKGAFLYCKDGGQYISGFNTKAIDTTGAGDSFWGGFLSCLVNNINPSKDDLIKYVKFGNATASLCVEKCGAIPAMPNLSQVNERLNNI